MVTTGTPNIEIQMDCISCERCSSCQHQILTPSPSHVRHLRSALACMLCDMLDDTGTGRIRIEILYG